MTVCIWRQRDCGSVVEVQCPLPFKDQKSANVVRKQLADLSRKINADISPVYTSRKIKDMILVEAVIKPPRLTIRTYNYFKNLLGYNLPVRPPLYRNLLRLKFETGFYFLKPVKKFCTLGQIR